MIQITIPIGKLFTAIEQYENIKIKKDVEYFQKTKIKILDKNVNFINVNGLYKKKDKIVNIIFSDKTNIKVAMHHKICIDIRNNICIDAKDIVVGDNIPLSINGYKTVSNIILEDIDYVFDIEVDSEDHLYMTSDGIVHHNTLLASIYALDSFFSKDIDRIHITRPTVSKEEIGFLPGNIQEKLDPWLAPIYDNFRKCYGSTATKKQTLKNMFDNEDIVISPLSFMRGITFTNSCVIVDECQNVTIEQVMMIVGRLGKGSKLIFCGDYRQVDLKNKKDSGLEFLIECGEGIKGFSTYELQSNHRHPILDQFMEKFDEYQKTNRK